MLEDGVTPPDSAYAQTLLPPDMDPVDATMIVTFREVLSSIPRFHIESGETVVVYGAGPVGLSFVKFLKRRGCTVVSVDISDEKVERAKRFGADYAVNSTAVDVVAFVRDLFPQGVQSVVDAVGVNALPQRRPWGLARRTTARSAPTASPPKLEMNLSWAPAPYNWSLTFVQFPEKKEEAAQHEEVMEMIRTGELVPRDFISLVLPQGEIATAFDLVEQKKTDLKTVIEFRA